MLKEVTTVPKKINPVTWKIFCQENIEILPGESTEVTLPLGVKMSEGAVLVFPSPRTKDK